MKKPNAICDPKQQGKKPAVITVFYEPKIAIGGGK
jgi:hypothetical protein